MILVDSSVWIDYFRGTQNPQTDLLDALLEQADVELGVADLVVFEVLRGFASQAEQQRAKALLLHTTVVEIGGLDNALIAAEHHRALRARSHTIRSPIDVLQASHCITHGHALLHRDADFDAMETWRGLSVCRH